MAYRAPFSIADFANLLPLNLSPFKDMNNELSTIFLESILTLSVLRKNLYISFISMLNNYKVVRKKTNDNFSFWFFVYWMI